MARLMTDHEKQIKPVRTMAEELFNKIDQEVTPDWRLAGIHRMAKDLAVALISVDLSGEPKPIIPVRAFEVKREYISEGGFPTTQFGVRVDWDGKPEWGS